MKLDLDLHTFIVMIVIVFVTLNCEQLQQLNSSHRQVIGNKLNNELNYRSTSCTSNDPQVAIWNFV